VKDRLWKFTSVVVDVETHTGQPVSRLFRRESCRELAIDVQGMQLEKVKVDAEDDEDEETQEAYVIRLDRGNVEHLIEQYEEVNGLEGYDFDPELDFLMAAQDNSGEEDEILIICLVIDDGTTHDLGSDDDY
jgi:hypothetical protein